MGLRTLNIVWLTTFGLFVGFLTQVTSDVESPCDGDSHFKCRSDPTICISLMRVRDGTPDCPDKSDEECHPDSEFECQTIHQCIPKERLHDGWPDCDDGSDEECARGQHRCRCGLPHCIDGHKVKDGVVDCDDGSDEGERRNQTSKCPGEDRLQDLMAVEKRKRRKRQIGAGFSDDPHSRPIPSVRVVPTRRAYVRRIRPGNVPPQPIPEEPFRNIAVEAFGLPQNGPNFYTRRYQPPNQIPPSPFLPNYPEERIPYPEQPSRNQPRRPTFNDHNTSPQNRRVIRLRRPGNVPVPQPDVNLLERKPIVNSPPENEYVPLRARGPVILTNTAQGHNLRDIDNNLRQPNVPRNFDRNRSPAQPALNAVEEKLPLPSSAIPLTYYTTFTYMTTFLNGPSTAYSTREAVVSNIATETLNPKIIDLIKSRGGFSAPEGAQTAVPLGSRALGPSTTVVNLASRVQVYNSDIYYSALANKYPEESPSVSRANTQENNIGSVINTLPIAEVASLPKTYYTLFTYYYTLHDGDKSTYSQRSEVISNVATDTDPFLKQSFTNTIDKSGYLTLSPEKELINLGSREAGGMTTEVNLELRTLVHFDNLRNVVLDRSGVSPSLVEVLPTNTRDVTGNNYLEPGDAEVQDQNTYPQTVPIEPSFTSGSSQNSGIGVSRSSNVETPQIPDDTHVVRTQPLRGPVRVASTKLQRPGTLRSGVFLPRPGVRVRVRPVTTRRQPPLSSVHPNIGPQPGSISEEAITSDPNIEILRRPAEEEEEDTKTDEEEDITDDEDEEEDFETEEEATAEENASGITGSSPEQGRRRLKITIRRPSGGNAATRSRPRFYVVTRTGSPGGVRPGAVSVKVSRRPRPSEQPQFETYTTVTSVPVVFGLSTTFRNAVVTSSSLVQPQETAIPRLEVTPSKTLVLTYFTTTTYTVPFTVSGQTSFTTFEETNSRVVTETVEPDADLSFVSTTILEDFETDFKSDVAGSAEPSKTLLPVQLYNNIQTLGNQLNVGNRHNLVTKVSNGVTLIVASDGGMGPESATGTLQPTTLTDALLMMDKDFTTLYQPRTFYTTFTYITTFFSNGIPSTSTSEQVVTNVYTISVTQPINNDLTTTAATDLPLPPVTVIDTMEQLVSTTLYTTNTFYATLFDESETIVTPIEEIQSLVISSTETYTITKTIQPTATVTDAPEIRTVIPEDSRISTTESTIYKTLTNLVTLFGGSGSIVSTLEEVETQVVTLTLDRPSESHIFVQPTESYTTRTIQATNTHYVTLFNGGQQVLSSITEVVPTVITELVRLPEESTKSSAFIISPAETSAAASSSEISTSAQNTPMYQDLVPSVRTQYTTLTYFTTLYQDSSTILSSREEIATSYVTLFVPVQDSGATSSVDSDDKKQTENPAASDATIRLETSTPSIALSPTTEVLTFYTTYTYYTTLFRGTETIISDSETVVTQYVTIETTPTEAPQKGESTSSASLPSSEKADVRVDSTVTSILPSEGLINIVSFVSSVVGDSEGPSTFDVAATSSHVETVSASILTGTPTTDANGATHILFTDFIVPDSSSSGSKSTSASHSSSTITPALPDEVLTSNRFTTSTTRRFENTRGPSRYSNDYSDKSQTRATASDIATTRLTDVNVVTHLPLHPTTSLQAGGSQTFGIKPGAVIDLSDVLGNTNLVGNLGETIKDIVNLFAAGNRDRRRNNTDTRLPSEGSNIAAPVLPSGGVPVSNAEEPLYIPIGAIGKGTKTPSLVFTRPDGLRLQPNTLITGFTPVSRENGPRKSADRDEKLRAQEDRVTNARTSIVFGTSTIFIEPTIVASGKEFEPTTSMYDSEGNLYIVTNIDDLAGSRKHIPADQVAPTPVVVTSDSTSIITGIETIFFGVPDARLPQGANVQGDGSTSSVVGVETIYFDDASSKVSPTETSQITGETTIFGSFPILFGSESTSGVRTSSATDSAGSGATTIFFPLPEEEKQRPSAPGTRYVTSVESVTLTLTLTTSSVFQSEDTPVTITSVFTTTIPPRTFVTTIIGSRTILGTQPEPTEAVQVIPTTQPSESTTTVTTTTLIFNSIATTVVRTLLIPTNALKPTKATIGTTTGTLEIQPPQGELDFGSQPKSTTPGKKPQLFKQRTRPTSPPTPKPGPTGPPLKLFPTRPTTTSTNPPPPKLPTTRKTGFKKPGKALVPETDGCPRECDFKNKEVCKQNADRSWSCQCRPGFFRKQGSEECRDVKSYTVLVRVLQMGGNEVTYDQDLTDTHSPVYQNLTTTARKAVDEAYKLSAVGDEYVNANVLGISNSDRPREGVLVNLTVTLTGDKPTNEDLLRDELAQSLEASASEAVESNATLVSAIIQKVEDVQDFDECADDSYNDCSRSAECINLPGTYTCECKEGYQDLEPLLPGRICSGEIKDCDFCNNRGVCIMTEDDQKFCRCYRMYLGKQCEINGLVLAIALPIALAMLILTMFCFLCGCRRLRRRRAQKPKPNVFKGMVPPMAGTLDRKAMIMDSSSESSNDHAKANHGYDAFGDEAVNPNFKRDGRRSRSNSIEDRLSEDYGVPTVVIPRARHHHPKQVNHGPPPSAYHQRHSSYDDQW